MLDSGTSLHSILCSTCLQFGLCKQDYSALRSLIIKLDHAKELSIDLGIFFKEEKIVMCHLCKIRTMGRLNQRYGTISFRSAENDNSHSLLLPMDAIGNM